MNPFEILKLDNTASPSELKAQYKKLLFKHHPDHGGTVCGFLYLNKAYKEALEIAQNQDCDKCQGFTTIPVIQGFGVLHVRCQVCNGTGKKYK